jgi:RNA polymerase-binding transcription factor DksA
MSKTKDEIEETEGNWADLARSEGYLCERCGSTIPYDEREIYFETKLCDWCRDQSEKHD